MLKKDADKATWILKPVQIDHCSDLFVLQEEESLIGFKIRLHSPDSIMHNTFPSTLPNWKEQALTRHSIK